MVTLKQLLEQIYQDTPRLSTDDFGEDLVVESLQFSGTIGDLEGNVLADASSGLSFEADHDNSQHTENYTTSTEAANAAPVQSVNGFTGAISLDTGDISRGEFVTVLTSLARIRAEIGLESLGYDTATWEIYTDDSGVDTTTNTEVYAGSDPTTNGYATLQTGATDGTVLSFTRDVGVIPESLVVVDEMFDPLPSNADAKYKITDQQGNSVTFTRDDIDTLVNTSSLTTFGITVELQLSRDNTDVEKPTVDSWSVYASGQQPSGDYFDAVEVGAPAETQFEVTL